MAKLYGQDESAGFVNGVLADGSDVRKFLPTALIMTAIANLCFALSAVFITPGEVSFFGLPTNTILLWLFVFFWGASGWFQSAGFPAVAKSLTYWYSNSERGTKWSLWSCSHQMGTFLSVIILGYLVAHFGWRMAFFVPGALAILVATSMSLCAPVEMSSKKTSSEVLPPR